MKARLIVAAIFVPILFVIIFFLPPIVMTATVAIICGIISFELIRSTKSADNIRIYIYSAVAAIAIPFLRMGSLNKTGIIIAMFCLMAAVFAEAILAYEREKTINFTCIATVLFAGGIIPLFMSSLSELRHMTDGRYLVLLPFIVAFISDGGAYFAGVLWGRHKVTPHVSPNKSLEGYIGGFIAAILGMVIYGIILKYAAGFEINILWLIIYGIVGSLVTQLGDLSFSLVKREYKIKDYGNLLPGHGGMLDRFDSMIFAAPVIYVLVEFLPAFCR